jgi:hypothetical protein
MQEGILPNRILHFTQRELIWECSTYFACECGNAHEHNLWKQRDYSLVNDPRTDLLDKEDGFSVHIDNFLRGRTAQSLSWIWERMIEQYSERSLTVPGDKLAAISGLAKLFEKSLSTLPHGYIAGMWKVDIPICLLWYVTGSPAPSRPEEWRAPSWSWASIDGSIGFFIERYQFSFESNIRVEEYVCEPLSVDPFGKICNAKMKMVGCLVPVRLEVKSKTPSSCGGQYGGGCGQAPRVFEDLRVTVVTKNDQYEILPDLRLELGTYGVCTEG